MAYNDVEILRDKNGNPIPQYYNVATGQFEPLTGENGATHTQLTGSNVEYITNGNNIFIPSGTNVNVIGRVDVSKYAYIFVQVRPRGLDNYRISYRPTVGDGIDPLYSYDLLDVVNTSINQKSELERVMSLQITIWVENRTENDTDKFETYLFGVMR